MLGYDWPRLHAALNDLPTALLLTALLFDVVAAATKREGLRLVSFWTLMVGAIGRSGGRHLRPAGRGAHRPRRGGA